MTANRNGPPSWSPSKLTTVLFAYIAEPRGGRLSSASYKLFRCYFSHRLQSVSITKRIYIQKFLPKNFLKFQKPTAIGLSVACIYFVR